MVHHKIKLMGHAELRFSCASMEIETEKKNGTQRMAFCENEIPR